MEDKEQIIRALTILQGEAINIPLFKFHIAIDNMLLHRCDVILGDYKLMYEFTTTTDNLFMYDIHTVSDLIDMLEVMPPDYMSLEVYEIEEIKKPLSFVEDIIIDNSDLSGLL